MEDEGAVTRPGGGSDQRAQRQQLAISFKAQHFLVVAFFILILYYQFHIEPRLYSNLD